MSFRRVKLNLDQSEPSQRKLTVLSRVVSRMDGATLDRLWEAALRGDMALAEQILDDHKVSDNENKTPQWSETNSWAFGRVSKKR